MYVHKLSFLSSYNSAVLTYCVFVVMNFEKIMEFWLLRSAKLKEEHKTCKQLVENRRTGRNMPLNLVEEAPPSACTR